MQTVVMGKVFCFILEESGSSSFYNSSRNSSAEGDFNLPSSTSLTSLSPCSRLFMAASLSMTSSLAFTHPKFFTNSREKEYLSSGMLHVLFLDYCVFGNEPDTLKHVSQNQGAVPVAAPAVEVDVRLQVGADGKGDITDKIL